jgi:hypothetical protein
VRYSFGGAAFGMYVDSGVFLRKCGGRKRRAECWVCVTVWLDAGSGTEENWTKHRLWSQMAVGSVGPEEPT